MIINNLHMGRIVADLVAAGRIAFLLINQLLMLGVYAGALLGEAYSLVHCALCIVHCALCIVHCALCIVHCALCIVHCA